MEYLKISVAELAMYHAKLNLFEDNLLFRLHVDLLSEFYDAILLSLTPTQHQLNDEQEHITLSLDTFLTTRPARP